MSVKLCQHFDNFETWTPVGNATVSNVHKFGAASACFASNSDYFSVSNNSGLFNLSPSAKKDFECFFKPALDASDLESLGFFIFNGHAYKLFTFNDKVTWTYSKSYCENLNGHLAVILNQDTDNFILRQFINNCDKDVWIGGYKENGSWKWVTGDDFNYSNWDENKEDTDYLEILATGFWDADLNDYNNYNFLCEWDNLSDAYWYAHGYKFFNGHSFKLVSDTLTWHDAKSACEALGGHLATITSSDKNSCLASFAATISTNNVIWLGGYKENSEGNWRWINSDNWNYTNWYQGQPNNYGGNQFYLVMESNGEWSDEHDDSSSILGFICEWDYDFRTTGLLPGNIFNFGNLLSLSINSNAALTLASSSWNINSSYNSAVYPAIMPNEWQHILLRIQNNNISVYLNGLRVISENISGDSITPASFSLGGFSGYLDEFVVLNDCNNDTTPPERPYHTARRYNSAPVSRATWSASGLPDGLTLSSSGVLSGTPIVTGTFDCNVSINTDWGTDNMKIRIVIN